jgi:type I restriction enzyme S subunit
MPVPPIEEQRAITDYLDTETARIDALIEKKQRMMELFDHRIESLIEWHLEPLVVKYGEVALKAVAELRVSNVDKKTYEGQIAVRLCNYTDVYYNPRVDATLDFMSATADPGQVAKLTLRRGDVLITKDSETADDIGVPALVMENLDGVVLGYHLAMLRPTGVEGGFLYWAVLSHRARDAFALAASGVTRFGLRQDAIGRVPIPNVPLDEQHKVTSTIDQDVARGRECVSKLSQQVELLREHRRALITAAVTGELKIEGVVA